MKQHHEKQEIIDLDITRTQIYIHMLPHVFL